MRAGALKAKERLRLNNLKILHFDSTDNQRIQAAKSTVDTFCAALGIRDSLSDEVIMDALKQVHIASDEYYSLAIQHSSSLNQLWMQTINYGRSTGRISPSCAKPNKVGWQPIGYRLSG